MPVQRQPLAASVSKPLLAGASFSVKHRVFRVLWGVTWTLCAAWTPPPLHRWRAALLRAFGADVHPTARVYGSVRVWFPPNLTMRRNSVLGPHVNCYCMDRISIGESAVVSQGTTLCGGTHDITDPDFQLLTRPVNVGAGAWIAAEAFIGPGVSVGAGAVVGARAVLFTDAEADCVYVGNPAKRIKARSIVRSK
jgi:putative colanic acid biosynthesis acetyltransferase WcaF